MALIYGVPASPYVRKVMLAHGAKGVPYELQITTPGSDDEDFRAASPFGKIPAYKTDDGFVFSDSSAILGYLERLDYSVKLYPADNNQYARALYLEEYADTQMMAATAALYFQLIIGPKFFAAETDSVRVEELTTQLIPTELDYIEGQMSDGWLVGDSLSVADMAVGSNLMNLLHTKFELDATRWPKTKAYFERLQGQEFYTKQIESECHLFASA